MNGSVKSGTVHWTRSVEVHCASSMTIDLAPAQFDAVLTDPPYLGNVQYAELMDFCYVWLRLLAGLNERFDRCPRGMKTSSRRISAWAGVWSTSPRDYLRPFQNYPVLKPGGPLVFTYHHNRLEAYLPLALAILDSGMTCSGSIPCPGEMGASIHIHGTGSSIVDTVFVCSRNGGTQAAQRLFSGAIAELTPIVARRA